MPADQAAGLRRRQLRRLPRSIHCFFDDAESAVRLAQALYLRGCAVLLVDARGRLFDDAPSRSLFDWRQQLARGQLHVQPAPYGGGWHAPGLSGEEPALAAAAEAYDCLVFDAGTDASDWTLPAGAARVAAIEVKGAQDALLRAYAVLKTLAQTGAASSVGLLGDPAACERLEAACRQFLDPAFAAGVVSVARELDGFAALAVRMADEEASLGARNKTGNT